MDKQILHNEWEKILYFLKELYPDDKNFVSEPIEQSHTIRNLMMRMLELYRHLKNDSSIRETLEFQEDFKESIPLLNWAVGSGQIFDFISDTEDILSSVFYDNEWEGVCRRRSAIEALKEMYGNTQVAQHFSELDTEDLDLYIKGKGEMEGGVEKIPDGIPPSHWWWWYPDPPPETSVV
jgi:hypothetical protein